MYSPNPEFHKEHSFLCICHSQDVYMWQFSRSEYIRDIRNIRSSNQIRSDTEILFSDQIRSRNLNIRKVRVGANIKCFEFFGQPKF